MVEQELENLRSEHEVRLVEEAEEGLALERAPNGVYGFTTSPAHGAPLFRKRSFRSFEVHKLPDGSGRLVGYITPKEAIDLEMQNRSVEIHLYPEPWGDSSRLVSVAMAEMVPSKKGPARSDGCALSLLLE